MNSIILRTATRFTFALLLLFSIVVLLQGHNRPGGGFIGGLIAAAAFSLHALAFDPLQTQRLLVVNLRSLIGAGLVVAIISGVISLFFGRAPLTGLWVKIPVLGGEPLKVGTPLLFDVGVYLVVVGVALTMVFTLMEPKEKESECS